MFKVCLVTGGAGFIGSSPGIALLGRGFNVRVLDNLATRRRWHRFRSRWRTRFYVMNVLMAARGHGARTVVWFGG